MRAAVCTALFSLLTASAHALPGAAFSEADIAFFVDEVRPILSENCFQCHGGEGRDGHRKIKSGFQVISRKGILTGGEHGPAYNQSDPSQSKLLQMISYKDDNHQMPPKGKLEKAQIATLTKWMEMGVPWTPEDADVLFEVEDHAADTTEINETTRSFWSHKPMERPAEPKVDDPEWAANPIDVFIHAKLAENGLKPNGRASKRTLIRRAYYNLTGLPPTAEQVAAFEADDSPDAFENLVEELLASPHYGEKWARHWLDVVRYADSNGFERDGIKQFMWRYRDYVVGAFNDDMPYDRFIREQLAGDEMDDATIDQIVAAGFHRLGQWDDEPADPKQHYYDVLDDNVRTTSEGVLAMTLGCARCHDHKADPVSQKDYYRFMSAFNGYQQMRRGKGATEKFHPSGVDERYSEAIRKYDAEAARLTGELNRAENTLRTQLIAAHPDLAPRIRRDGMKYKTVLKDARTTKPVFWRYTTEKPPANWSEVGFRAENEGWKEGPAGFGKGAPDSSPRTPWTSSDLWLQTTFELTKIPKSARFTLYHDEDVEIYLNGQLVLERTGFVKDYIELVAEPVFIQSLQTGRNVIAVHVRNSVRGQFFDLGLGTANQDFLSIDEVITLRGTEGVDTKLLEKRAGLLATRDELERTRPEDGVEVMTIQEKGKDIPLMKVHIRGNPHAEGEDEMTLRAPEILGGDALKHAPPANGRVSTGRRTALAEWLTKPDNRRTARVMVNRIWQHQFGRGICPSPNDFGYLGEAPTHPELLDWLACEFVERGWSVKEMQRLIMTSKAWQMSSAARPDALAQDPQNNLFWRFNMRRLTAEEIRDSVLAAAGQLNLTSVGGPSTFPKLPEAVLKTSSNKKWKESPLEEANRRSLYITVMRSIKPPEFTSFDFADTDSSCPVRFTTTVPTQALNLINGEFFNEQSTTLAGRVKSAGDAKAQIRRALEITMGREANDDVVAACHELFETLRSDYKRGHEEAMRQVCLLIFNLNEFIYLD